MCSAITDTNWCAGQTTGTPYAHWATADPVGWLSQPIKPHGPRQHRPDHGILRVRPQAIQQAPCLAASYWRHCHHGHHGIGSPCHPEH